MHEGIQLEPLGLHWTVAQGAPGHSYHRGGGTEFDRVTPLTPVSNPDHLMRKQI